MRGGGSRYEPSTSSLSAGPGACVSPRRASIRATTWPPLRSKSVVPEVDVRRFEKENLIAALEATRGQVYGRGGAADLLGVKPSTLASRLKKLGIATRS